MSAAEPLLDALSGTHPAVLEPRRQWTAAEVRDRALSLAGWLRRQGVEIGDRVVLLVPPGGDFAASLLGVVSCGAVPVLLETTQASSAYLARIRSLRPRFVLAHPLLRWVWALPGLASFLRRRGRAIPPRPDGQILRLPRRAGPPMNPIPRAPEDEALILFTSGTTGAPKAIVHTHGNLPHFLGLIRDVTNGLSIGTYLAETPQQILYALLLGSRCHVIRGHGERRVRATLKLLQSGQIQAWFGSPWTWQTWLRSGLPIPSSVRTVILGSSPVTRSFLVSLLPHLDPDTAVRCLYGLSESGPVCVVDGREKAERTGDGDWVGPSLPGVTVAIEDDEVCVQSPAVAGHYLPSGSTRPWLHTGDLGRTDDHGVWLLGRKKDMILRRGINLYPGVLEPLLADQCEAAALVGVWDEHRQDERVVLAVVGGQKLDPTSLLGDASPDHVLHLDALPRSGRQHKVDKKAIRDLARERFGIPE